MNEGDCMLKLLDWNPLNLQSSRVGVDTNFVSIRVEYSNIENKADGSETFRIPVLPVSELGASSDVTITRNDSYA